MRVIKLFHLLSSRKINETYIIIIQNFDLAVIVGSFVEYTYRSYQGTRSQFWHSSLYWGAGLYGDILVAKAIAKSKRESTIGAFHPLPPYFHGGLRRRG